MDGEKSTKALLLVLAVLAGLLIYRIHHPSATLAVDGTDPDWDAAVARSLASNQPTVILFTANWCPVCRQLHSEVLSKDSVQEELSRSYNFYTVDLTNPTRETEERARKMGVTGIPVMIRFDAKGKETDRTYALPPDQLINWLKAGE